MVTKLVVMQNGYVGMFDGSEILHRADRVAITHTLRMVDAGHLDALRHYAEHGTLPQEAPVWPKLRVSRLSSGHGWHVLTINGKLIASVTQPSGSTRWQTTLHQNVPPVHHDGETPQAAVDTARAWLADFWGLST